MGLESMRGLIKVDKVITCCPLIQVLIGTAPAYFIIIQWQAEWGWILYVIVFLFGSTLAGSFIAYRGSFPTLTLSLGSTLTRINLTATPITKGIAAVPFCVYGSKNCHFFVQACDATKLCTWVSRIRAVSGLTRYNSPRANSILPIPAFRWTPTALLGFPHNDVDPTNLRPYPTNLWPYTVILSKATQLSSR